MQTKTRFDRLPKRDRDEVLRIDGLQSGCKRGSGVVSDNDYRLMAETTPGPFPTAPSLAVAEQGEAN
jgi:hypothetical protein